MTNTKSARIWEETITIPTYPEPLPDPNPMFFEKRVNQGASGRVYPNPFTDHLNHEEKVDQEYQAVFLENEYLQLMVLPRFGGRIHAALDKTNGYDFIYHQHVIKPALIGLFGSWLSGGMEFNWPLHHRPSTFMPVEYTLEESEDGSVTIWLSEHEPLNRMQGMVGVCVYPGRALIELKVQVFNRTPLPQPFLWWVNTAVHVNDNYQLIFPPDVESVTFHSRAFMAQYPVTRQKYAGLDWTDGVDISWPRNVANATSYFANASKYNFFGGYDHGVKGGIIHVANRHISPGKKLFTWGMGEFGSDWQGTLTDEDGPYIELMASAYSDNQPDFSWLQPYEYRTFSQFWYPIQQIGVVKNANQHLAVNLETDLVGVCATEVIPGTRVILTNSDEILLQETVDLEPGKPFIRGFARARINLQPGTKLQVLDSQGKELIAYTVQPPKNEPLPDTAKPPKLPHQIDSLEELYLTGLHVEQYLHFSLDPAPYWERALEIDPSDSRSNNALGRLLLRRGDFARAERLLRSAIQTLTRYNFNPYDGEPHYNLGLALAYQGSYDQAYDHFYKATWSYAWRSAGYYSLAQIDVRRGEYAKAIEHLDRSLVTNAHLKNAYVLKAALLRRMGETESALQVIRQPLEMDPLDHWAHSEFALLTGEKTELTRILRNDVQNYLDLAFDYANSGMYEEASNLLLDFCQPVVAVKSPDLEEIALASKHPPRDDVYPIVYYMLGNCAAQMGDSGTAAGWYQKGSVQAPDLCFPVRLEEQIVLEAVREANPTEGRAAYYLGNLYYDKKQFKKAITAWQSATQLEPDFSIPWRNLGIALFNKQGDKDGARNCYNQARAANSSDPRLLMEMDQLLQHLGVSPLERLVELETNADQVRERDDLSMTAAELYSKTGQPEKALEILTSRQFHAWEGGEGGAAGQYSLAYVVQGKTASESGNLQLALEHFMAAEKPPDNLGIGRGMSLYVTLAWFNTAETLTALGDTTTAESYYRKVIDAEKRASLWGIQSELNYYAALSVRSLGRETEAEQRFQDLQEFARKKLDADGEASFYTSKPAMIVFDDDPRLESQIQGHYMLGLANLGLGNIQEAITNFENVLNLEHYHFGAAQMLKSLNLFIKMKGGRDEN